MRAFHNDPKVKAKYTKRLEKHHAADQIIRGSYWIRDGRTWKGCAVGCTIHGEDHKKYETELGIPQAIARLEDRIFESLPTENESRDFAVQFLEVIPVGADLTKVASEFCAWVTQDILDRPRKKELPAYVKKSVELVRATFKREVTEGRLPYEEWAKVREVSRNARADADDAYAAAYAAYAAADADDAYAAYATYAAADAYADAARREFWQRAAAQLLKLLAEAPIPQEAS